MIKFIALVALLFAAALANDALRDCHNITGTCLSHGFVCSNEQVVPHAQRCDGVEDCTDGTDEFMCDSQHKQIFAPHGTPEHKAQMELTSCARCTCYIGLVVFPVTHPWVQFALNLTPYRNILGPADTTFRTGWSCHPLRTTSLSVAFFKKDIVCRGFRCCARQVACLACSASTPALRCW